MMECLAYVALGCNSALLSVLCHVLGTLQHLQVGAHHGAGESPEEMQMHVRHMALILPSALQFRDNIKCPLCNTSKAIQQSGLS